MYHYTKIVPKVLTSYLTCSLSLSKCPQQHWKQVILKCKSLLNRDQARGRLGRNSRPRGPNFVLNGTQGEVGVSLKKNKNFIFFFFLWRLIFILSPHKCKLWWHYQTIYYHCIVFLLPLRAISGIVHAHHSCGGKRGKLSGSRLSTIFKFASIQVSDTFTSGGCFRKVTKMCPK